MNIYLVSHINPDESVRNRVLNVRQGIKFSNGII